MMMLAPLPNPVPGAGNFNVMLPGKFWRAAKNKTRFADNNTLI
jgi:hypothetical protein